MASNTKTQNFGLGNSSPARGIYDAVFHNTGIHRQTDTNVWRFDTPEDPPWRPLWLSIVNRFNNAVDSRVQLAEIADSLPTPPGKSGIETTNALVLANVLTRRDDILLYEDDNLVPRIDDSTAIRLHSNLDRFSIKNTLTRAGQRQKLTNILIRRLGVERDDRAVTFPDLVSALYGELRRLPPYTLQTVRGLSRDTLSIRQCFRGAVEPDVLLFETIPVVLMIEPFDGVERFNGVSAGEYTSGLTKAIRELKGAYAALLGEIDATVTEAFIPSQTSGGLRDKLTMDVDLLIDQKLAANLVALVDAITMPTSGQEWLEGLATAFAGGIPPRQWDDAMADSFSQHVDQAAQIFRQAQAVGTT